MAGIKVQEAIMKRNLAQICHIKNKILIHKKFHNTMDITNRILHTEMETIITITPIVTKIQLGLLQNLD